LAKTAPVRLFSTKISTSRIGLKGAALPLLLLLQERVINNYIPWVDEGLVSTEFAIAAVEKRATTIQVWKRVDIMERGIREEKKGSRRSPRHSILGR
jgi:hypothetical protein